MEDMILIETSRRDLKLIKSLWEKLNDHHRKQKSDFKDHYENFTFSERAEVLLKKSNAGDMHIGLVKGKYSGILVAYCITTISEDGEGEIDSIYVEKEFRGQGLGDELMKCSLGWLDKNSVKVRKVTVAKGNSESISFYERYGFRTRAITLEQPLDHA